MGRGYRAERLAEEIRKVTSELLLRELKDPRLSGIVSISAVEVTPDYSLATLYLSVLGNEEMGETIEESREKVLEAFQSAKGFIRREIGRQIKLKHVPDILFKIDSSLEYGRKISQVLAELNLERADEDEE